MTMTVDTLTDRTTNSAVIMRKKPVVDQNCSRWDWKAWSRSGEIAPIVAADATHWIKVKNPASLAMNRAAEIDWSR